MALCCVQHRRISVPISKNVWYQLVSLHTQIKYFTDSINRNLMNKTVSKQNTTDHSEFPRKFAQYFLTNAENTVILLFKTKTQKIRKEWHLFLKHVYVTYDTVRIEREYTQKFPQY